MALAALSGRASAQQPFVPLAQNNTWTLRNTAFPGPIIMTVQTASRLSTGMVGVVEFQNPVSTYSLLLRSLATGTVMDGFAIGGVEYRFPAPAPLFPVSSTVGQTWSSNLGVVTLQNVNQTVVTPAGTFTNCNQFMVVMTDGTTWEWTVAPGIGFVEFGTGASAFSLQSFEAAPEPPASTPSPAACPPLGLSAIPDSSSLTLAQRKAAFQPAYSAGARMLTVVAPWNELEPSPGKYNFTRITDELSVSATLNIPASLTIGPIFSGAKALPADLASKPFDDPSVINRFLALLAALRSQVPSQTRWLNLGYEVDVYLQANPGAVSSYATFLNQVSASARGAWPQSFGVVYSLDSLRPGTTVFSELGAFGDHVAFDYYAIQQNFIDRDPSSPEYDLWLMRHLAVGRPVLIHELGYATSSAIGGSPATQQQFFQNFFSALEGNSNQIAGVTVWSMNDMPQSSIATAAQQLQAGSDPNVGPFLGSLGLRQANGVAKPSWSTFTTAAAAMPNAGTCTVH